MVAVICKKEMERPQMAKITITLTDETEKKLRSYVTSKYPEKPFGKLSGVVEEALIEYFEKRSK
jgi:hypothetical protein